MRSVTMKAAPNKKKIIFSGNHLYDLMNFRGFVIRRLHKEGHQVIVIAPKQGEFGATLAHLPKGVRFIPVKMDRCGTNPFRDLSYYRSLLRIYKKERPDFIFHYSIKPNIYGTVAATRLGIPNAAMIAGLGYAISEGGIMTHLANYMYRKAVCHATRVFTLSRDNYDYVIQKRFSTAEKTILLKGGEGVDLKAYPFKKNASPHTRFLLVARVLADKGYHEFVEAARIVRAQYPEVRFQLLGTIDPKYPLYISLEKVTEDVESGAIEYLGSTDNVVSVAGKAGTVVVLPSYHEGMSRSLMEALSMGKPIIASDIPGCREMVMEGVNGFLCQSRDARSLADACLRYLQLSEQDKEFFSLASRRLAEQVFDIGQVYAEYKRVLREALGD